MSTLPRLFAVLLACALVPAHAVEPLPLPNALPMAEWRAQFLPRAVAAGLPAEWVQAQLAGLEIDPRVVKLDTQQPEFSRPVSDYIRGVVAEQRVKDGQSRLGSTPTLAGIERSSGVPATVLLGIWALESAYGQIQGDLDVLRSLATLAADGRRRDFAESELIAALRLLQAGRATRAQLVGSWAGAVGQTQLLPSKWLALGVDGDGDGRVDPRASAADALASAARLLSEAGWIPGGSWSVEVLLPADFDYALTEDSRLTPAQWAERGVLRADQRPWPAADGAQQAVLLLPAGAQGPAFLALPNHTALRAYNNSIPYALGVGLLADRIGGAGPLHRAWPVETPLSLEDRTAAQVALAALAYPPGPPDGIVGAGTRRALRAWQQARGLPADGYLSPEVIARLRQEAAGPTLPESP